MSDLRRPDNRTESPRTCGETNALFGLVCNRERGHVGVHMHINGDVSVHAWGVAPEIWRKRHLSECALRNEMPELGCTCMSTTPDWTLD